MMTNRFYIQLFLLLITFHLGSWRIVIFASDFIPSNHSAIITADDKPITSSTKMVFDPMVNMVVSPDSLSRHIQTLNDTIQHVFFEAEDMNATGTYMNIEWIASRTGYTDLFPSGMPTEMPRPQAGNSPYLSGTGVASVLPGTGEDTMSQLAVIKSKGLYTLWVRYQTIFQLPAPFDVIISQNGRELLRQRFNEQSKALDYLSARLMWEMTTPIELEPGEIRIELTKVKDESPGPIRGPRYVDCFLLTNDLNFLPSGVDILPSSDILNQRQMSLGVKNDKPILTWSIGRYQNFNITSWPNDRNQLWPSINLCLPRNANANDMILVTSLSNKNLSFQRKVELHGRDGKPFTGDIEVFTVVHMQSRYFGWVPHALFRRNTTHLSPYHTVGIWLKVSSRQAKAGDYSGELTLSSEGKTIAQVPLKIQVLKSSINSDPELNVLLWRGGLGYKFSPKDEQPEMMEKYWENDLSLGWNIFKETPPWTADESRQRGVKSIITSGYNSPDDESAFLTRLQKLRDIGWKDNEIWIEAFDEPSAKNHKLWIQYAKAVKKSAPETLMWINPQWQRNQTEEVYKKWAEHVDVWWPYASNLNMPAFFDVMKKTGKPIGFYIERGWSGMNPASAECYFRKMPILTAKYDIDGCGFWCATCWESDPWNEINTDKHAKSAIYYPGANGPINSINYEAWREGLDELLVLRALTKSGKVKLVDWPQRLLSTKSVQEHDELRDMLYKEYDEMFK